MQSGWNTVYGMWDSKPKPTTASDFQRQTILDEEARRARFMVRFNAAMAAHRAANSGESQDAQPYFWLGAEADAS